MRKKHLIVATVVALSASMMMQSCIGSFALFNKVKNSDAGTLQNLANSVLSCCQTTMSNGTMAGYLAQFVPKARSINLQSYRLPVTNSFRDVQISGMQVLQSDQSKNIAALKSYLPW